MNRTTIALIFFTAALFAAGSSVAQDFPSKPIRIIVADTPAGGADTHARILSSAMAPILGQPVVVENKPGAAYAIGYEYVAKRVPADGYTVALVLVPGLVVLPLTAKNLNFDPLVDLPPFIGLTENRLVFGSSPKRPWTTFAELVAYGKANPGKLTFGSNGVLTQIINEAIAKRFGFKILVVPFSSGGSLMQAVIANQVDTTFVSAASARSMGENLRVLTLTGAKRAAEYPDVPTFRELGMDNLQGLAYSMNAPVGTPSAALEKLHAAASQALKQPDVVARIGKLNTEIVELSPEAARRSLVQQAKFYADLAREIGIKPE